MWGPCHCRICIPLEQDTGGYPSFKTHWYTPEDATCVRVFPQEPENTIDTYSSHIPRTILFIYKDMPKLAIKQYYYSLRYFDVSAFSWSIFQVSCQSVHNDNKPHVLLKNIQIDLIVFNGPFFHLVFLLCVSPLMWFSFFLLFVVC